MNLNIINGLYISNVVSWVLFGLFVAIVVHILDKDVVKGGVFGTILSGVLGAVIGGFVAALILNSPLAGFNIEIFLIAVGASLIVIFLYRILFRRTGQIRTHTENLEGQGGKNVS